MAIRRLMPEAVFQPEEIAGMTTAYEAALAQLGLADRTDRLTEMVARKIIDLATAGERDPDRLCSRALKELGAGLGE